MSGAPRGLLAALLRGELRYLLRDRAALVLMVLGPVLVYPALFYGMGAMQAASDEKQEAREITIAADPAVADWLEPSDALVVVAPGALPADQVDARVVRTDAGAEITYRSDRRDSRTARDRLHVVLDRAREADQAARWAELGVGATPDTLVAVTWTDISTAQARSGHRLGRFLPLLLIFLAMSGGLYTALDLISGEKERGTLETLLTTRAPRATILRAKFLVVLLTTAVVSLLAVGALFASAASGAFLVPGSDEPLTLPLTSLALTVVLVLPLVVELAAILSAAAAYAPDFRTGQALGLPLMLILLAPAAVTAMPGQELGWLLGAVPITGVALALRDALAGELGLALGAWTFTWSAVHAGAALWVAERLVGREAVLLGGSSAKSRHARGRYHVEAFALYAVVLGLYLFLGQLAQSRDLVWGLLTSQLLFIAAPAVVTVALLARPLRPTLRLVRPRVRDLGLAAIAGLCAPGVGATAAILQDSIIPVPVSAFEQFADTLDFGLPLWGSLLVIALLPAVCEELLFRGAILGLLEKSLPQWSRVLVVALLFGALHMAIFRVFPTGVLGILLTWAALRSGSVFVPMLIHLCNNSIAVLLLERGQELEALPPALSAAAGLVAFGAVAAMGRGGAHGSPQGYQPPDMG